MVVKYWTEPERIKLSLLAEAGLDPAEIGRAIGRTKRAVAKQASDLCVSTHGNSTRGAREFMRAGGLVREDQYTDATDVPITFWTAAHRSAECDFPTAYLSALKALGWLKAQEVPTIFRYTKGP